MKSLIAKSLGKILSRNYYLSELARLIIRYRDNDQNCNILSNGELLLINRISSLSDSSSIFLDIGANVGDWSSYLIDSGGQGTLYCIEPFEDNVKILKDRLKSNNLINCNFIQAAISNINGNVDFFINKNSNNSAKNSLYDMEEIGYFAEKEKVKTNVMSLDSFYADSEIDSQSILFVKVDIEGNEYYLLKGANDLLKKSKIDFLQFEFGHASRASRIYLHDIYNLFSQYNYKLFIIKPNGLLPLKFTPFIENRYAMVNLLAINHSSINLCKDLILKR